MNMRPDGATRGKWTIPDGKGGEWCVFMFRAPKVVAPATPRRRSRNIGMSPKGESFKYVLQMHFLASNNAAGYEALFHGLRIATALGIHRLRVLGIHCSLSTRPTKSGHIWMTK
jgi:ribonuclease HI